MISMSVITTTFAVEDKVYNDQNLHIKEFLLSHKVGTTDSEIIIYYRFTVHLCRKGYMKFN